MKLEEINWKNATKKSLQIIEVLLPNGEKFTSMLIWFSICAYL
jgi:hypothetical protein